MIPFHAFSRPKSFEPRPFATFRCGILAAAIIALAPFAASALPLSPPAAIQIKVDYPVENGGKKWIASDTEMRAVYPVPLASFRSVLEDYAGSVNVIPNLAEVHAEAQPDGTVLLSQRYEIVLAGFKFPTLSTIRMSSDVSALPRQFRLSWSFVSSDGSMADSRGYWELTDASEGGQIRTSVRHVSNTLVRKNVIGQDSIMRSFSEKEVAKTLDAIAKAAQKR
jgi:hypothetical protein